MIAGSVLDIFGPRLTLICGITGYPLYIGKTETSQQVGGADNSGGLWYFDAYGHLWFPVFAGAYLGLSAGCLWTTAG